MPEQNRRKPREKIRLRSNCATLKRIDQLIGLQKKGHPQTWGAQLRNRTTSHSSRMACARSHPLPDVNRLGRKSGTIHRYAVRQVCPRRPQESPVPAPSFSKETKPTIPALSRSAGRYDAQKEPAGPTQNRLKNYSQNWHPIKHRQSHFGGPRSLPERTSAGWTKSTAGTRPPAPAKRAPVVTPGIRSAISSVLAGTLAGLGTVPSITA